MPQQQHIRCRAPQADGRDAMAIGDDGGAGGVRREGGGRALDPSKLRMMEVFNHRIYKIFQVPSRRFPRGFPRRFPRGFPRRFPR